MSYEIDVNAEVLESEKAILSSVLYYFSEVEEIVNVDSISTNQFVTLPAKRIWQAINSISPVNGKYDSVLVLDSLKKFCLSRSEFERCINYFNDLPHDIHYFSINKYLKLLHCGKIKRDLDFFARKIAKRSLSIEGFDDEIEVLRNDFNSIISQSSSTNYLKAGGVVDCFDELISNLNGQENPGFLKTNFFALDQKIRYLGAGQLVVIASRPGVGKTTFALNLIYNNFPNILSNHNVKKPVTIGVFSLEMTNVSLIAKLIAIDAQLELNVVQRALDGGAVDNISEQLIQCSKKKISSLNLLFCDEPNITIGKMAATIKTWVREYDLKLVIIDYLQLVNIPEDRKYDNSNQYQKIGLISRNLKILAMELKICIVALAQLNRKAEERRGAEKSPILSDLRESGSIEQDADIVMFLYEDKTQVSNDSEDQSSASSEVTYLKVAKNRHGPVGTIEFCFDKSKGVYKSIN